MPHQSGSEGVAGAGSDEGLRLVCGGSHPSGEQNLEGEVVLKFIGKSFIPPVALINPNESVTVTWYA